MGVAQEANLLQIPHDRAYRCGRDIEAIAAGDRVRAHRLAGGEVLGHDRVQDLLSARANIHLFYLPQGSAPAKPRAQRSVAPAIVGRVIYLDNAASTSPAEEALAAMMDAARGL